MRTALSCHGSKIRSVLGFDSDATPRVAPPGRVEPGDGSRKECVASAVWWPLAPTVRPATYDAIRHAGSLRAHGVGMEIPLPMYRVCSRSHGRQPVSKRRSGGRSRRPSPFSPKSSTPTAPVHPKQDGLRTQHRPDFPFLDGRYMASARTVAGQTDQEGDLTLSLGYEHLQAHRLGTAMPGRQSTPAELACALSFGTTSPTDGTDFAQPYSSPCAYCDLQRLTSPTNANTITTDVVDFAVLKHLNITTISNSIGSQNR